MSTQRYNPVPPISDRVCRLVLGTSLWETLNEAEAHALFDAYVAFGGNCLDTALVYYDIERVIGSWMKARANRAAIILHAKGAHHETIRPEGAPHEFHRPRVNPPEIETDIQETLRRLGTDCIDIFTLHRDDPDQPVGPIIECLGAAQRAGRIKAFGASNWPVERLEAATEYARQHGLPSFATSSPHLALAFPAEPSWPNCLTACDRRSRDWYARELMPLLAWSPLALGYFTERYQPWDKLAKTEQQFLLSDRWTADVVRVYYTARNFERRSRAQQLAREKAVSATQIALAWVLHQGNHVFAVVGPRTIPELRELFDAFAISLTSHELAWLNLEVD